MGLMLGAEGLLCGDDEAPEEKLDAMGETKKATNLPLGRGFAFAARRRRQAFARPLVGPPNTLPVLSAPGWILMSLSKLAHSSQRAEAALKRLFEKSSFFPTSIPGCWRDHGPVSSWMVFVRVLEVHAPSGVVYVSGFGDKNHVPSTFTKWRDPAA